MGYGKLMYSFSNFLFLITTKIVMGKTEGTGKNWHGHVTAITVAPEYRRLGLADGMMNLLEAVSEKTYDGWFVDLYVRVSNAVAIDMYRKFGYSVYRRVRNYYAGGQSSEDAYGKIARSMIV